VRTTCPECGQPVKPENLGEHVSRVHPSIPRRRYQELGIRRPRGARTSAAAWAPYVAILLVVTVGAGLYFVASGPSGTGGRFFADHTYYDLGKVPQSTVEHTFSFENRGEGTLAIFGAWTSCGCTSARVVIGGSSSPVFGMHDNPPWEGRLVAGATATLVVQYDALAHPDLYVGDRSVFVKTNDGSAAEIEFRIHVDEA